MKNIYINSRIHPLLVNAMRIPRQRQWIYSQGETWLLLTPGRLARLANWLGMSDSRVFRLIGLVKRYSGRPDAFCRRLGIPETVYYPPEDYPPALCPHCDGVHFPHPEEIGRVCDACHEKEALGVRNRPCGGQLRDRHADRAARERLLEMDSSLFYQGELSPNYKLNLHRRLDRDWDKATNRILTGGTYRQVAREFDCSVGVLHRRVKERSWENN